MGIEKYVYNSILKNEIYDFLKLRAAQGRNRKTWYILLALDVFLTETCLSEKLLKPECIDGWVGKISHKMSISTQLVYISHYTQFAKYLQSMGIGAFIPERPVRENKYVPYIFSREELDKMFETADKFSGANVTGRSPNPIHFPMLIRILYGCGVRLGEALSLTVADIDLDEGVIKVRNAKGNKDRLVPMDESLTAIFRRYMSVFGKDLKENSLIFESRKHTQYSEKWALHCFQNTLKHAGIALHILPRYSRNICVHCLRHTFAVNSFRKQDIEGFDSYGSVPLLSVYMGHDDMMGTESYLHMTAENSNDIYEKMNRYTEGILPEAPK